MRTRLIGGLSFLLASAALAVSAPGTASAGGAITVKGSDTMVILGQRWAEVYMKAQPRRQPPGDGRRLGHRASRADQRHHRHLPGVARR